MSLQVKQSLKDIAPGIKEPLPTQLLQFAESLYLISLQKKGNLGKNEVARHLICAFLAVNKYQHQFNLPPPVVWKIPIPPRQVNKVVEEFSNLANQVKSVTSTPKKPRLSPLKSATPNGISDSQSPFESPTKKQKPRLSPLKVLPLKLNLESTSNAPTPSPLQSPNASSDTKYTFRMTVPELINMANAFKIPASIVPTLVQVFIDERNKYIKKSQWYLGCGLIYCVYIRVNHRVMEERHNVHNWLITQLFNCQRGTSRRPNIAYWCNIIDSSVKHQPWVISIEKKYMYRVRAQTQHAEQLAYKLGPGAPVFDTLGSMINANSLLDSEFQHEYYQNWTSRI